MEIRFDINDVSEAFRQSECHTLRGSFVYLGKMSGCLGMLTAIVRNYDRMDTEEFASEYVSRGLSGMNEQEGFGRYTIFGTELKADRRTFRSHVSQSLSGGLRNHAGDFYVVSSSNIIDGVSGLRGIRLSEMKMACEIAGAELRNGDLIIITTDAEAIRNIEKNLKRLLSQQDKS